MRVAGLIALVASMATAQVTSPADCVGPNAIHAILARGESAPGDPDPSLLNVLVNTRDTILRGIPGSTVVGLQWDYFNLWKPSAVVSGSNAFKAFIRDYSTSCPDSKIAILGYSLGAIAMMETLCGTSSPGPFIPVIPIDPKYTKNVVAAFTFGDETHNVGQPWAQGTCPDGVGLFPRLNNFACGPWANALHTYCDQKDDQCCAYRGNNNNVGHFGYWVNYADDINNFIKSKLAGNGTSTNTNKNTKLPVKKVFG